MSSTVATTTSLRPRSKSEARLRRPRPRLSIPNTTRPALQICKTLPYTLEALDLSSASPTQTLASLRFIVLSYLAHLERRLSEFESPDVEGWMVQGELTIEEAVQWARTALEMLESIRADVCFHLPEIHFADLSSVETFLKSHLPDFPDVPALPDMRSRLPDMTEMRSRLPDMPAMADVRSHLPDMPHIPDMAEMRSHLPELPDLEDVRSHISDMALKLEDVRTRFHDLDFDRPLDFLPTLSAHLHNLHSHLSTMDFPSALPSFPQTSVLSDFMDSLMSSELFAEFSKTPEVIEETADMLELAAQEVAKAVKRSFEGVHLISYHDLPHSWKNNPFVVNGYRFIPIERWPLLLTSIFKFHNETLNIHTHLIPFLLWSLSLVPLFLSPEALDLPEVLFTCFALLCLFSSTVWHTMSGCADHASMEFCARVDYVGIGWLISASIGTAVHYGFQCNPQIGHWYLALCAATGLAGNIFPFMNWFNMHEYRLYRIGFFLALAFSGIAPMVSISLLHSKKEMFEFVGPVGPSLLSYLVGLFFYAAHFPERALPDKVREYLDSIGGGSHAIWHCFIVLAVSQHKTAIELMKPGIQCIVDAEY